MLDRILSFIKKFITKSIFKALQPTYHFVLGYTAALWYGRPSEKMIVVGVTGTTGKTTTIFLLANILQAAGLKSGYISTAMFSDGAKKWLNDKKMTLPGRFFTQRLLSRMKKNGCAVALIETTSQSVVQFRHRFINYDTLLFTGLYPEHIEAHGGFKNYKKAKGKLFAHLENYRKKKINGKAISKTIIVNADDANAGYFLDFWAEKKIGFTVCHPGLDSGSNVIPVQAGIQSPRLDSGSEAGMTEMIQAKNITYSIEGSRFIVDEMQFRLNLLGEFNVENALAAIAVSQSLGIPLEKIKEGLERVTGIPGRLEKIESGKDFMVIVDYAYEPNALAKLYATVKSIPHRKIIHVLGSAGGGRDKARRPKLGKLADDNADYIVVTNEDPYDENPVDIINQVFSGVVGHEVKGEIPNFQFPISNFQSNPNDQNSNIKTEGVNCWRILDRREAIKKALALAGEKDIVLVTGKGSEQAICVANGKKIPWDDRKVIREVLQES
ncbi:MAG: hypothetical protein A2Z52_01630 [Candidatus Moranbacteria bacterium RBG_19FT_COMBO_42_6]|nr:MAG: hypothetical protein A2Z52_01630 [Candidatus Moranbacteria bacterium RBG_19FT_COMBO_42_6]